MRLIRTAATAAIIPTLVLIPVFSMNSAAQEATPATTSSCETMMTASPMAGMDGMAMGTPAVGEHDMTGERVEFDQLYIDMMVPHHESIIALAEVAQDRLTDERLQTIAEAVVTDQEREVAELRGYRDMFYGSPRGMPMDPAMMDMMMERMPGMGDMDEMAMLMDAGALVGAFCAAEDPDLAFIDLTIPHHQMAIDASMVAYLQAVHPEIKAIAKGVIEAQEREIEELTAIRAELTGESTPASS
jgi:uncharacterized protein (DUF305 family)